MANPAEVGLVAGARVQLPWQTGSEVLPAEFPALHFSLIFTRSEVDALGGLHLFRADNVEPAKHHPHGDDRGHPHGAPQIAAIVVNVDVAAVGLE